MQSFTGESGIFSDPDKLQKDYTPDTLPERRDKLSELHSVLKFAAQGGSPLNAFIYGKTGQGKTAAVKVKTDQLQRETKDNPNVDISVYRVRCNSLKKSYHVIQQLVKELRGPGAEKPKGYQQQDLFEMAFDEINKIGGTVIIVLDEIDSIGNDDDVLYELPRARRNEYIDEDVNIAIIGISNDFQFRENLRPKVKDTLCDEEIEFPPYDANQLRNILKRRAAKALRDTSVETDDEGIVTSFTSEVLDDDVIPLCSAFAAQNKGSARQAIKYLFKACRIVDDAGESYVTESHVRDAQEQIEREFIEDGIESLTTQDHLTLAAAVRMSIHGETPARSRDLYSHYRILAGEIGADVNVIRRVRDNLRDLELYNVLDYSQSGGYKEGTFYEYRLAVPADMVIDIMKSLTRVEALGEILEKEHQTGRPHLKMPLDR